MDDSTHRASKVLPVISGLVGFFPKALHLDQRLGNLLSGKDADFIVLNKEGATPLLKRRLSYASTLEDKLFVLMTLGDDRSIMATYIDGKLVFKNQSPLQETH